MSDKTSEYASAHTCEYTCERKGKRVPSTFLAVVVAIAVTLAPAFLVGGLFAQAAKVGVGPATPAGGTGAMSFSISVSGPVSGQGFAEPAAAALVLAAAAGFFGVDTSVFVQYAGPSGGEVYGGPYGAPGGDYDFGPGLTAFYLARDSGLGTTAFWSAHRSGTSWWALATRHGLAKRYQKLVPPGMLRKGYYNGRTYYYVPDEGLEQAMAVRFVADYYRMPTSRVWVLVSGGRGLDVSDVFLAINVAGRAKVAPEVVIEERRRGYSWDYIKSHAGHDRGHKDKDKKHDQDYDDHDD